MKNNQHAKLMTEILNHLCNYGSLFDKYVPKKNTHVLEKSIVPLTNFIIGVNKK
ncbi:hypothetical protein EMGBD3_17630 [Nitrosarchaeum sp.]|nr:hypothetical protein EMGBD3_17630 [Nitrosarchaeum sp.]